MCGGGGEALGGVVIAEDHNFKIFRATSRLETLRRVNVAMESECDLESELLPSWGSQSFLLRPSIDYVEGHQYYEGDHL